MDISKKKSSQYYTTVFAPEILISVLKKPYWLGRFGQLKKHGDGAR